MKVVLDTNVLISGMINPAGAPGRIVDFLRAGLLSLVVDDRILAEYIDVLGREHFSIYFTKSEREDIIEYLLKNAYYTVGRVIADNLPDKGDVPFLEIALSEKVPLVTGNVKHYPKKARSGCTVLSPRQFIDGYLKGE
ncbi:MAG: putative toxin-antitoxin system toxin component, PIN family [Deltaproteobacteria bacterium]|nr:putative toxin-antitoxin system toxin component, PIN family [Deltaproteobacteria bacterium]